MIITRTPYRISFAGGGTDRRSFYSREPGQVLSATIDRFLYVVVRRQLGLVEHKYRLNYSHVEFRDTIDEIEHPLIRAALRLYGIDFPIEITTFAEIPAFTGMGSSSAFAVGLVKALDFLLSRGERQPGELAKVAAHLEMDVLGRCVGKQDHYASAYGGFNRFAFHDDESVSVFRNLCCRETQDALESHLMLFYTGIKRDAAEVLDSQGGNFDTLRAMKAQVGQMRRALYANDLSLFGRLLLDGWRLKKELNGASNDRIDGWYDAALRAGASGGKLLGAGGGGFLLFFVPPERKEAVAKALPLYRVPFKFSNEGSKVIYREGV